MCDMYKLNMWAGSAIARRAPARRGPARQAATYAVIRRRLIEVGVRRLPDAVSEVTALFQKTLCRQR